MPLVVLLAVLVGAPLWSIVVSLRSTPRDLDALQQRDAAVAVVVDPSATWQPSVDATLTLTLDHAAVADVAAPPWKGTVTAVALSPGATLHAGDTVVEIDGIRRIFAPSPAPLWRSPSWGDVGPDIDGLAALLSALQLMTPQAAGTPFGSAHVGAIEHLARSLGAPLTSTLDLGWLVWSPVATVEVTSSAIRLGDPAPPPGSTLFPLPRTITSVVVAGADGRPLGPEQVRRSTIDLGADGAVAGAQLLDAPEQIPALRRVTEAAPAPVAGGAGSPPAPPTGAATGGAGGGAAGGDDGKRTVRVTLRGEQVAQVAPLPLGAIVTDADGTHCVVSMDRRLIPVEVVGSDAARVFVQGADGQRVAANPASAFGVTACH